MPEMIEDATTEAMPDRLRSLWAVIGTTLRSLLRHGLGTLRPRNSPRRMELVETLNLGGKRQLMLVLCEGQRFLVGAGAEEVQSIINIQTGPCIPAAERADCVANRQLGSLKDLRPNRSLAGWAQ